MALTPEKYQKLQALLSDPEKELSEDFRARAQAAVDEYKNDFLARGAAADEKPLAEGEGDRILSVGKPVRPGERHPDEAQVQRVLGQLDPAFSLPAQVLAVQPATTHPGGDEAAKDEWIRGDLNNPNGLVVAYDLPVSEVRKKLLEQPELFRALQLSVPAEPEAVMAVEEGDSTHQAFNDYMFRQAAEKATAAGKTIYRYSKAPWLSDGNGAGFLHTLKTKWDTTPADAPQAFVLGYDDTANFGAGKAAQESGAFGPDPETQKLMAGPRAKPSFETVGGMPEGLSPQERNDALEESSPAAYTFGQTLGMLAPWTVANKLWGWVVGEGAEAGAKTVLRGLASGAGRGAAAGAADQTAREGVQAASSYAATGDSGTTLADSGGRVLASAAGAALPASVARGLGGLGNQLTEAVEWGGRYGEAPGRLRAHGVETSFLKGHQSPPVVKEAVARGRAEGGRSATAVLASELDEPLSAAAQARVKEAKASGGKRALADAKHAAQLLRAGQRGGVRKAVEAAAKNPDHPAIPALRDAARRAGGSAPEQLRGALVSRDLRALDSRTRLGGKRPGRDINLPVPGLNALSNLTGVATDALVLKGAYPLARNMSKAPKGGAQRAARLGSTATRNTVDGPADERREEREKKASEGYRERAKDAGAGKKTPRKKRKIVRRRVASSEAEQ